MKEEINYLQNLIIIHQNTFRKFDGNRNEKDKSKIE